MKSCDSRACGSDVPRDRPVTVPTPVRSIYVHAPFCARRCVYCDFAVTVRRTGDLPAWLEALAAELAIVEREALLAPAASLDTLYVGGGTPSLLGPGAMAGLRNLYSHGDVDQMSATDAIERLGFVSLLFKRVDKALENGGGA